MVSSYVASLKSAPTVKPSTDSGDGIAGCWATAFELGTATRVTMDPTRQSLIARVGIPTGLLTARDRMDRINRMTKMTNAAAHSLAQAAWMREGTAARDATVSESRSPLPF